VAYVRKPFLAKIREVSYPIPVELPVTTATLWLAEGEGGGEEHTLENQIPTFCLIQKTKEMFNHMHFFLLFLNKNILFSTYIGINQKDTL